MEPSVNVNANGSMFRNKTSNAFVCYHLNKLLASQFNKPPQDIAEASRSAAAAATAAAAAARAARANANAKAYAAAKAVAAAKAALNLIASFPNQEEVRKDKHLVVVEAEDEVDEDCDVVLQDQELASGDAGNGMMVVVPDSTPSCEQRKNEEWSTGRLRERVSGENDVNSNKRSGVEVGSSSRVVESSVSGQGGGKEDVQKPTRKRGRPRKH
ncbi:unnamed protein product [Eruca vesicaria subsp. sativa]|uniref:Uncharacterized protein n=1 Tax=Eruca vesicaria subsp. sativa TaxID=29727 RepID=A0ABC8JW99_ERUVS|nr:unnamed protein product [Eruca vesicaria subsp. sativa]